MTVHVFAQAIPQAVLAAVRQDALALAECSNFWVPKERVCQAPCRCSSPAELAVCLLYQHVAHLLPDNWQGAEYWVQALNNRTVNGKIAPVPDTNQVYKPGVGLGFHFDKDEHLLKLTGEMVHPAWSSVLYLTGSLDSSNSSSTDTTKSLNMTSMAAHGNTDGCPAQQQPAAAQPAQLTNTAGVIQAAEMTAAAAANVEAARGVEAQARLEAFGADDCWDGYRQAPTVILEQRFDQQLNSPVPLNPNSTTLVWPLKGNYCVFDGQLGHGVLDSCSRGVRATLLVNWWTSCPQDVHELPDTSIKQYCLTHLDHQHIHQALLQQDCSYSSLTARLEEPHANAAAEGDCPSMTYCNRSVGTGHVQDNLLVQTTSGISSKDPGIKACNVADDEQCNEQQQQQRRWQPCVAIPEVLIPLEASAGSNLVLVDDMLSHSRLPLVGTSAMSAVHFVHPGYTLCPIEAPQEQDQVELQPQPQDAHAECLSQQVLQPGTSHFSTSSQETCPAHPDDESRQGVGAGSDAASRSRDGCEGRLQTLGAFVLTDFLDSEGSDSSAGEADSSSEH